jgi:hypothetical protein
MGWQEGHYNRKKIDIGDEPMDLVRLCLEEFSKSFQTDLHRRPVLDEFLYALVCALETVGDECFEDLESQTVASITLRKKSKKTKRNVKIKSGDIFAIPLGKQGFRFGRALRETSAGELIEIYEYQALRIPSLSQLLRELKRVSTYKHVNGIRAFKTGRWKIIGNHEITEPYPWPKFYMGSRHSFFIVVDREHKYRATPDDLKRLEPVIMFSPDHIEQNLLLNHSDPWPEVQVVKSGDFEDKQ